jgi:hypothetical protein
MWGFRPLMALNAAINSAYGRKRHFSVTGGNLESRRVSIAGITDHPDACWMRAFEYFDHSGMIFRLPSQSRAS